MNNNILVSENVLKDWVPVDQGHFGSVYKAKHTVYKINVAVKKLKGNVPHGLKELMSEAEKMASASTSPYIIRLIGFLQGTQQGPPGIVMEYMKNGSLYTLMEKVYPIPWALKYRIIYQVTLGMNWLHNLPSPLLHLDLKTKNVLLNEELHIKITDFGLSKYTSCSAACDLEDCQGIGGTLEYMPPEAFQEGYQPCAATDVYSFAILCAVVLRGESPYPVDRSALIRELVPRGQRPCLQALEKETTVNSLNEAIEFTKCCWDNDKFKRPPFTECCNKWEDFSKAYRCIDVRQAVRQVQDRMDSVHAAKTTTISYPGETASVNTKDMSEMVHRFQTINVSETPSALLGFVPTRYYPNMHSQSTRVRPGTVRQGDLQGAVRSNYGSHSAYYPGSVPVMSSPTIQSQPTRGHSGNVPHGYPQGAVGSNTKPQLQYYQGVPQFVYPPFTGNIPQPNINFPATFQPKTSTINICGSSNFQIGDYTTMNVTSNSNPVPYPRMNYRPPVHTMRSPYHTFMNPQPQQTPQGYYKLPEQEASSDQPSKQKTAVQNDQNSHIHPVQTTPDGHSLNVCNPQQVTQGSMPTTEKPTIKHPGQ